jgi:CheY-like chemotaxis protein
MARQKPGLIVLDLTMPGMDGFDFIAALRQVADWRKIPIAVLTAKEVNAEERKPLSTVVQRILRKGDFHGVGLAREIADLLRGCQTERPKLLEENH